MRRQIVGSDEALARSPRQRGAVPFFAGSERNFRTRSVKRAVWLAGLRGQLRYGATRNLACKEQGKAVTASCLNFLVSPRLNGGENLQTTGCRTGRLLFELGRLCAALSSIETKHLPRRFDLMDGFRFRVPVSVFSDRAIGAQQNLQEALPCEAGLPTAYRERNSRLACCNPHFVGLRQFSPTQPSL